MSPEPPLQFTLRSLLILQAIVFVFLWLLSTIHVFAALLALVLTLVYALVRVSPELQPAKRLIIDLMGGIVLPLMCLYFDPGILRNHPRDPVIVFAWVLMTLEMIALAAWLAGLRGVKPLAGVFVGLFWIGALFALLFGILLAPLSLIGILFQGVGLLGFTPLLTAYVLARNAVTAVSGERTRSPVLNGAMYCLGVALAIGVPVVVSWTAGDAIGQWVAQAPQNSSWDRILK